MDISIGYVIFEILLLLAILVIIYIIFALGRLFFGLIMNSALGLISIWIVNTVFGLGISFDLISWIIVAILGLPAVAIIIILKLLGISI